MVAALASRTPCSARRIFSGTFTSQCERDPESALMRYRARSYDPRIGRFVQRDPLIERRVTPPDNVSSILAASNGAIHAGIS